MTTAGATLVKSGGLPRVMPLLCPWQCSTGGLEVNPMDKSRKAEMRRSPPRQDTTKVKDLPCSCIWAGGVCLRHSVPWGPSSPCTASLCSHPSSTGFVTAPSVTVVPQRVKRGGKCGVQQDPL